MAFVATAAASRLAAPGYGGVEESGWNKVLPLPLRGKPTRLREVQQQRHVDWTTWKTTDSRDLQ